MFFLQFIIIISIIVVVVIGACMVYGQPSIAVSYSLTNVRIRKYSFTSSNFASDVILNNCNVCEGCSNCSDVVNRTAEVNMNSSNIVLGDTELTEIRFFYNNDGVG